MMKTAWLHKNNKPALIIFCNGWGMDENPFKFLGSNKYDVLMFYDYRDLDEGINITSLWDRYEKISLISWSMGVWAGQVMLGNDGERFDRAMAINGTLAPIDDQFGIPREAFEKTFEKFDKKTSLKFYARMCREKGNLDRFLANQPRRSIENRRMELDFILNDGHNITVDRSIYKEVVIADKDFIIPTRNQMRFWQGKNIHCINSYHFLFYRWQCWDEIFTGQKSR